jgi:hypothetical protein
MTGCFRMAYVDSLQGECRDVSPVVVLLTGLWLRGSCRELCPTIERRGPARYVLYLWGHSDSATRASVSSGKDGRLTVIEPTRAVSSVRLAERALDADASSPDDCRAELCLLDRVMVIDRGEVVSRRG